MYKLAICIPVFNGDATIEAAIQSSIPHLTTDTCLIISDNASTDRTLDLVRGYTHISDHIYLITHDKTSDFETNFLNCAYAANKLSCEFVSFIGDDDICLPQYGDFIEWLVRTADIGNTDYVFINSHRYTDQNIPIESVLANDAKFDIHNAEELSIRLGLNVAFTPTMCFRTRTLVAANKEHVGSGWFFLEQIYRLGDHSYQIYPTVCTKFFEGSVANVHGKFFYLIKSLLETTDRIARHQPKAAKNLQDSILTRDIIKTCYTQKLNNYRLTIKELFLVPVYCKYSFSYGTIFLVGIMIPRIVYQVFHYTKHRRFYTPIRRGYLK